MNEMPWGIARTTATRYFGSVSIQTMSTGRKYSRSWRDYVDEFYSLLRRWESETRFMSSSSDIMSHPSMKKMVEMGEPIIPLIVDEIARGNESLLPFALNLITKEIPYSDDCKGDLPAIREAWLAWAERNSF